MTQFYAQPYDITATGFYFENVDAYRRKARACRNRFGDPDEEFEIQFIDGEAIDAAFVDAIGIHQANLAEVITCLADWDQDDKKRVIIAVGEGGYCWDQVKDDPEAIDSDIFCVSSMRDLAVEFLAEGLFGEIPPNLEHYIDKDAIAQDLAVDYCETEIAGEPVIYRLG